MSDEHGGREIRGFVAPMASSIGTSNGPEDIIGAATRPDERAG